MKGVRRVFYIFFMIFAAVLMGVFGSQYFEHLEYKKIAETGVEVTAQITGGRSDVSINGVHYYYLNVRFYDKENGDLHTGRTSTRYTKAQGEAMWANGEMLIKYNPKNYKMVEADYKASRMAGTSKTIFFIASTVEAIMLILLLGNIAKSIKLKRLAKTGTEAIGNFLDYRSNVTVNGVPKYYITYSYTNDKGETKTTRSETKYNYSEVNYFKSAKTFPVRYNAKTAVIAEKPYARNILNEKLDDNVNYQADEFSHDNMPSTKNQEGHISIDTRNDFNGNIETTQIGHASIE